MAPSKKTTPIIVKLSEHDIRNILFASGRMSLRTMRSFQQCQPNYVSKLKLQAVKALKDWQTSGVPIDAWMKIDEKIREKFSLKRSKENLVNQQIEPRGANAMGDETDDDASMILDESSSEEEEMEDFGSDEASETPSNEPSQYTEASNTNVNSSHLTLAEILRHFACYTGQKHSSMSYLLKLLKEHKPNPCYDELPRTGRSLIKINGLDWPMISQQDNVCIDDKRLPSAVSMCGGKYMHFGLESALLGLSPGIVHRDADLLQFMDVYVKNPKLLPQPLRNRMRELDQSNASCISSEENSQDNEDVPHFEVDLNIDGVKIFEASDACKITPILGRIYSIQPNSESSCGKLVLSRPSPFIIGFYIGVRAIKDVKSFLSELLTELEILAPSKPRSEATNRVLTATVRVICVDGPMRSFLKCTKSHSGYWSCDRCIQRGEKIGSIIEMRNVNAPLRTDEDFVTYHVNDVSVDEHIPDPTRMSPFLAINFPMVTGFVIDPMHTMIEGAFSRRLEGWASVPSEEKLNGNQIAEIERRLIVFQKWRVNDFDRKVGPFRDCSKYKCHVKRQFLYYLLFPVFEGVVTEDQLSHVMLLQYAMVLLGTFKKQEISEVDINKANEALKQYSVGLVTRNIPLRFVSHQIIHLSEDVKKFKTGIETLSAFQFESFQSFFRNCLRSGNLPVEQIRNRLLEKAKYQLPTTSSGTLIHDKLETVLKSFREGKNNTLKLVSNGKKFPQRLVFPDFELLNRPPNNVCLTTKGDVFVCKRFFLDCDATFKIIGNKFDSLTEAFSTPFDSKNYNMFLGSKLSSKFVCFKACEVKAKVYCLPKRPKNVVKNFDDPNQSWFLFPLHHTYN